MNAVVLEWLQALFNQVADVKYATHEPDPTLIFQPHQADLVVQTWMGARVYVYVFAEEPKVRDVRTILRDNTRHGIATLFVLAGGLLPAHNLPSFPVEDWHYALFSLNGGWIYGYYPHETSFHLHQVHFTATPIQGQYNTWHMDDFHIENVAVRTRDLQEHLRGQWMVADIASAAYKRRVNYERLNYRFHYRTKQTHDIPHKSAPPVDELSRYYAVLEVALTANEREVKAAYRRMAMRLHPDVSALPKVESERRFKELNAAYEYIKDYHGWA